MRLQNISILSLLLFFLCCSKPPQSGEEVIHAMYERWHGKWYSDLVFEQNIDFYQEGKIVKSEVWQEWLHAPGDLHIRYNGFESGNGLIITDGKLFRYEKGQLVSQREMVHSLILLGFDVYFKSPQEINNELKKLGFDITKFCEVVVGGRSLYIVGASDSKNVTANQFWVDKERLYVLKVIETNERGTTESILGGYKKIDDKWVATHITFKRDGELVADERYFNITLPDTLNKKVFDTAYFKTVSW